MADIMKLDTKVYRIPCISCKHSIINEKHIGLSTVLCKHKTAKIKLNCPHYQQEIIWKGIKYPELGE